MLQIPHTATTAPVLPKANALPSDIPSLIALFQEANSAVTAAVGKSEAIMNSATSRAEPIYRALLAANARTVREEAQRLSCIADYCKELGLCCDLEGYFSAPDLYGIARGLSKLTAQTGPNALKIISKSSQPLSRHPEPSLLAELDELERSNDVVGMVALYDYFVSIANANTAFANLPRSSSIGDFLDAENERTWARAYAVADRLKKLSPSKQERERHARALMDAAFAMGASLSEVSAIALHLSERE